MNERQNEEEEIKKRAYLNIKVGMLEMEHQH